MRFLFLFLLLPMVGISQQWTWDTVVVEPTTWYTVKIVKDQQKNVYRYKGSELTRYFNHSSGADWKISLPQNVTISGVVFDETSCFMAGTFTGTCQMGSNTYAANYRDGWIARFAIDGTLMWFNAITGPNTQMCGEICLLGNDIAVIGGALDTVRYLNATVQNTFMPNKAFCFVAKISKSGQPLNMVAGGTDSTVHGNMYWPYSLALECTSDERGNFYLYAQFEGHTTIAGHHFEHPLHETRDVVLKFDNSLNLIYCSVIGGDCDGYCYPHHDLHVNTKSQVLLLHNYSYGQSGNDDASSTLLVLDAVGKVDTIVTVTRDAKGQMFDMDLDSCDNLYVTGYGRHNANTQPEYFFMTTYQLSPDYQVTWRKNDTVPLVGANVLALSYNECFVFANNTDGSGGVFKQLQTPVIVRCQTLTSLNESSTAQNLKAYPNPFDNYFKIEATTEAELKVFNITGQCIRQIHIGDGVQEIDTKDFPRGIYFLRYKNSCARLIKL